MTTKEKTAAISTALNLLLTTAKFILYYFTGSMAILAEAWHSFSDIGTSVLVFLAVRFQKKEDKESSQPSEKKTSRITLEHYVSLGIGIFLLIIALFLFYKVIISPRLPLQATIISGILFLFFSIGSYFVYKFETSVGTEEKSSALISDGLHSKADMAGAFLTGVSLIIYRLGINIDRPIAFLIALFILSFALESIIQVINPRIRRNPELLNQYRFYKVIVSLFSRESMMKYLHNLDQLLGKPLRNHPQLKDAIKKYYWLAILLPFFLWYASTCLVIVGPRQEGIKLRFNRTVKAGNPVQPGLYFKFPWPIEKIIKTDTREIRQMHIGNISDPLYFALLWAGEHGTGEPFLSGDNNYFHPYLILHYRIKNVFDFTLLHKDPEEALNSITHRIITRLFAVNTFYDIATRLRSRLIAEIQTQVQQEIDRMKMGIEILSVNMKDTHPPIFIADSFEKVIAAFQEKQQIINTAYGYRNEKLPEARKEAVHRISKAKAYNVEKKCYTSGDASRFLQKLESWGKHTHINRRSFYLKAMKEALPNKRLIIIDPQAGNPQIWMGFTDIPGYGDIFQEGIEE